MVLFYPNANEEMTELPATWKFFPRPLQGVDDSSRALDDVLEAIAESNVR